MNKIRFYTLSTIGKRSNNEDASLAIKLNNDTYFFAVADGMGGVKGGEIASNTILEKIKHFLKETFSEEHPADRIKEILLKIFLFAQETIAEKKKEYPHLKGMGTTLTALLIQGNKYVVGNIGDSRVYHLRDAHLEQITIDHSYIQEYKNKFGQDIDESIISQYEHILSKCIDGGDDIPDIFPKESPYLTIKQDDAFLLCSDGLIPNKSHSYNTVFKDYILSSKSLKKIAENLISFAEREGSLDNITVILAKCVQIDNAEYSNLRYKNTLLGFFGKFFSPTNYELRIYEQ